MKRGQVEMVGLVVIVILITLGMLFMAMFALKDDGTKKVFTRKGLAYSTVSATMKTTVSDSSCISDYVGEFDPQVGKDILEDCAVNFHTPQLGKYSCEGKDSCAYLEERLIPELLNETLNQWGKRYQFTSRLLTQSGVEPLIEISSKKGGCPKTRDRDTSGPFPIQTGAGLVETTLFLCD